MRALAALGSAGPLLTRQPKRQGARAAVGFVYAGASDDPAQAGSLGYDTRIHVGRPTDVKLADPAEKSLTVRGAHSSSANDPKFGAATNSAGVPDGACVSCATGASPRRWEADSTEVGKADADCVIYSCQPAAFDMVPVGGARKQIPGVPAGRLLAPISEERSNPGRDPKSWRLRTLGGERHTGDRQPFA